MGPPCSSFQAFLRGPEPESRLLCDFGQVTASLGWLSAFNMEATGSSESPRSDVKVALALPLP